MDPVVAGLVQIVLVLVTWATALVILHLAHFFSSTHHILSFFQAHLTHSSYPFSSSISLTASSQYYHRAHDSIFPPISPFHANHSIPISCPPSCISHYLLLFTQSATKCTLPITPSYHISHLNHMHFPYPFSFSRSTRLCTPILLVHRRSSKIQRDGVKVQVCSRYLYWRKNKSFMQRFLRCWSDLEGWTSISYTTRCILQ